MKTVYTPGAWDILHHGHLLLLRKAKLCGDRLIVGVSSDRLITLHKNAPPIFHEEVRASIIAALKDVDEVVIYDNPDQVEMLSQLKPDFFVVGEQFGQQGVPEHEIALRYCSQNNIPVLRLPRTEGISSSEVKYKVVGTERSKRIKDFWHQRAVAAKTHQLTSWQATSLTPTKEAAEARKNKDLRYILEAVHKASCHHKLALDLGCGTGRLTGELACFFEQVHALDFVQDFIDLAKENTKVHKNITYFCANAHDIDKSVAYDCCLIAGLFMHQNDDQLVKCMNAIDGIPSIILKESLGTFGRYELEEDHYSQELGSWYSGIYRSLEEVVALFADKGYGLRYSEMIEQHRKETHLRVCLFEKIV